jgi:Na+/proline symporter
MTQLSPWIILGIILLYFLFLIGVSWWTSRGDDDNESFFLAGRQAPWYLVAFGMIGASLSGVTFISIPGFVGSGSPQIQAFSYMQMVLGYLLGYAVIALVLIPLYYRLQLTSIYSYLDQRFGVNAYKTGAAYFLLSRVIGASFRLYLVAMVFHFFVTGPLFGIPFWLTVAATILLIWIYTFRGGIKTIVWTDTLQTACMLLAVIFTIYFIGQELNRDMGDLVNLVQQSEYSQIFFFRGAWEDPNNFFKLFVSGALIAIVMTGLDQDMMQKNLSIRTRRESQINIAVFSVILVFVNLLFLALGALLYLYATQLGLEVPAKTDQLYPMIALQHLPPLAGVVFILGLIAAAYSSADSALTALTTSFLCRLFRFRKRRKCG